MSLLEEPITTASGWTCLGKREGKGKGCQAPSGKQFRSKRAALEHLLSTGAPLDQVQIWKKLPHVLIFNIPNDFAIKVSPSQVREVQDLMIMRGFTRSGLPQLAGQGGAQGLQVHHRHGRPAHREDQGGRLPAAGWRL